MLNIIIGRISQGKTKKIISSIGKRIENKQKSILIVPQSSTYNFEKRICSQLNIQGFIDVEVCSFNKFASQIVDFCGRQDKCFLDDSAKAMLLRACIVKEKENLGILKNVSTRKGFVPLCLSLITNLQNCGYSPIELKQAADKLDDELLKHKLNDICLIYQRYMQILSSGYTDNVDRINSAISLIPYYTPLKDVKIFIDGFDLFTNQLFSFIIALAHNCEVDITISSAMDKSDARAYEFHKQTLDKLIKLTCDAGIKYTISAVNDSSTDKTEQLKFLEDNFYSLGVPQFEGKKDSIGLNLYKSVYDELTQVSLDISQKIRSGARYKDFCVLCANPQAYSSAIKSVFSRYNIPVFADSLFDITAHPVSRLLFSALEACVFSFNPQSVINYVLSRLTPLTDDEVDRFTLFIKTYDVKNYELENGLAFLRGKEDEQADFDLLREKVITPLKEFLLELSEGKTAKEKAKACYNFFTSLNVLDKLDKMVDCYEKLGFFDLSDVSSQIWNITIELLDSIASLMGTTPLTNDEFRLTLLEGFNFSPASTIPSVIDCVTFGDLTSGKEGYFKYVYVLGACEGVIPALKTPGGLLTSRENDTLFQNGIDLSHSIESEDARARYQVYAAFCLPKRFLSVSATSTTLSGASSRQSIIFKRFKALNLGEIKSVNSNYATASFEYPLTVNQLMLATMLDKSLSDKAKATAEFLQVHSPDVFDAFSSRKKISSQSITPQTAKELFAQEETTSISRLEEFSACPLSHFISYGLSPQIDEEFSTNALDVGNLIHKTLEFFVSELAKSNFDLADEICDAIIESTFKKNLPNMHFGAMVSSSRQRVLNNNLLDLTKRCGLAIKSDIGAFTPLGEEISFGYNKADAIEVPTKYGTLYLHGKIDRADICKKDDNVFVRIVDYKTGKNKFDEKALLSGEDIQLMLYMRATLNFISKNALPAEAYLMRIDPPGNEVLRSGVSVARKGISGIKAIESDKFTEYMDNAFNSAICAAEDMLSGNIKAKESRKHCEYCKYKSICSAIGEIDFSTLNQEDTEDEMD